MRSVVSIVPMVVFYYMGDRHFLPVNHSFRYMKGPFDGGEDHVEAFDPPSLKCTSELKDWK